MKQIFLPSLLPLFWFGAVAITFGRYMLISSTRFNCMSEVMRKSMIVHEEVHWKQIQREGYWRFYAQYVFRPTKRYAFEVEAYKMTYLFLVANNYPAMFYKYEIAKALSGITYFWVVSYKKALEEVSTW